MYFCVSSIDFSPVCDFFIGFWNCSDNVVFFSFSYFIIEKKAISNDDSQYHAETTRTTSLAKYRHSKQRNDIWRS